MSDFGINTDPQNGFLLQRKGYTAYFPAGTTADISAFPLHSVQNLPVSAASRLLSTWKMAALGLLLALVPGFAKYPRNAALAALPEAADSSSHLPVVRSIGRFLFLTEKSQALLRLRQEEPYEATA